MKASGKRKSAVAELFETIVNADKCSGCAACVLSCPVDALSYANEKPVLLENCIDCVLCSKACQRFEAQDGEIEKFMLGAEGIAQRSEDFGLYRSIVVARSKASSVLEAAQDGGIVSALLLHALEEKRIDGAIVSGRDGLSPWVPSPRIVTDAEGVLASAGSRYTYSPNELALLDARNGLLNKLVFVGTPCQITGARYLQTAKSKQVRKAADPVVLTIGLLCSETFTYEGLMVEKIQNGLGVDLRDVTKINIKGRVLVFLKNGEVKSIPLKQARPYARHACEFCQDFSAQYADISVGGLGTDGWTITILRTKAGEDFFNRALEAGVIETRPNEEFAAALDLLVKLAAKQKERPLARSPSMPSMANA